MKKMMMPYVYFQGKIGPASEATISLACNSLQYGTTCFAGIRGYVRNRAVDIFRLYDHYERLMNAAKIMGFNYYMSYENFYHVIGELIGKNQPTSDFYIRAFLLAPGEQLAPKPKGLNFDLGVYFVPLGNYFEQDKGIRLMISSWRKFSDTSFPTKAKAGGCYVNSFLATAEANRCGYDEALMMDQDGYIVEASVANLLLVYRNRLLMPELGSAQLEGITMRTVAELLREEGLEISYERIDRSMVYTCNELMLLGTAAQIAFAESVDDRLICNGIQGPILQIARKAFQRAIEGTHPIAKNWISKFLLKEAT